ncbi:hypothetical protein GUJ93_ZPchr0010g9513 [Zizania palustris]|uniref:Uncharacterized protein n=1 Tax=Zizania palustris TaxID=103762 RepID=A0A8J5TDW3_ZIZPA|nr:hypothetical protein GUJ93_ZPchr0010g9513 [Zizania palustris]
MPLTALYIIFVAVTLVQSFRCMPLPELPLVSSLSMEALPSRSDNFSHGWLRRKVRPAVAQCFKRLGSEDDVMHGGLGQSFNSSTASFIDMDPAELFSMRWTSFTVAEEEDHDFGLLCAGAQCSPLLVGTGSTLYDGHLIFPPCEKGIVARDDSAYADMSSSPL